jgi:nucleoid DNA-binding protein
MSKPNLTRREIIWGIAEKTEYPHRHVHDSVQMTLESITEALLAGRNVELRGFGTFEIQIRKSRPGRNPRRPEEKVVIPRRAVVKFKVGKYLREDLKAFPTD